MHIMRSTGRKICISVWETSGKNLKKTLCNHGTHSELWKSLQIIFFKFLPGVNPERSDHIVRIYKSCHFSVL